MSPPASGPRWKPRCVPAGSSCWGRRSARSARSGSASSRRAFTGGMAPEPRARETRVKRTVRTMSNGVVKTRITPLAALIISVGFAALLVVLDIATGPYLNLAIFKAVALLVSAAARNRRFVWAMCGALLLTTFGVLAYEWSRSAADAHGPLLANRIITGAMLLIVTMILDAWIRSDAEAAKAAAAL